VLLLLWWTPLLWHLLQITLHPLLFGHSCNNPMYCSSSKTQHLTRNQMYALCTTQQMSKIISYLLSNPLICTSAVKENTNENVRSFIHIRYFLVGLCEQFEIQTVCELQKRLVQFEF
jgi:hypothetical protein